jgi:hypothetical protein
VRCHYTSAGMVMIKTSDNTKYCGRTGTSTYIWGIQNSSHFGKQFCYFLKTQTWIGSMAQVVKYKHKALNSIPRTKKEKKKHKIL